MKITYSENISNQTGKYRITTGFIVRLEDFIRSNFPDDTYNLDKIINIIIENAIMPTDDCYSCFEFSVVYGKVFDFYYDWSDETDRDGKPLYVVLS